MSYDGVLLPCRTYLLVTVTILRYETGVSIPTSNSRFGEAQGQPLFSSMSCKGDESSLFECEYDYKREMRAWSGRVLRYEKQAHGVYCLGIIIIHIFWFVKLQL